MLFHEVIDAEGVSICEIDWQLHAAIKKKCEISCSHIYGYEDLCLLE
jgi:hypothetical protein